jgi:hypothetical protein
MPESQNLVAAKVYASMGWKVFPLRSKTKIPLTSHGFYDASDDPAQLESWWQAAPDAGIAIATGEASGIVVLDIDPRNGGDESFAILESQYEKLPLTVESMTGGGGRHLFFKCPAELIPSAKPLDGIDFKSTGGYVAVPFSTHPSGLKYQWKTDQGPGECEVAALPDWLLELLKEKKSAAMEAVTPADPTGKKIPSGKRNEALTSLAGTMQRRGMAFDSILVAILAENKSRCSPTLPESEVQQIVTSITKRYAPNPGSDPGRGPEPPRLIRVMDVVSAIKSPMEPISWLIPQRIAKGDCATLVGTPGAGKSWITLDIGIAGACELPILGQFKLDKAIKTLIVDEENTVDEVKRRLQCISRAWEINPELLAGKLFITSPSQGFSFRDEPFVASLTKMVTEIEPDLIVLDSATAVADIEDENKASQVRRFFHDRLYPLRAICGSTILIVHHTNKMAYQKDPSSTETGMTRGSIDFLAAPDSSILLLPTKKLGVSRMVSVKVRRGRQPDDLLLKIVDGSSGGARPMILASEPSKTSTKALRARTKSLSILEANPEGVGGSELVSAVALSYPDITPQDIYAALKEMSDENMVEFAPGDDKRTKVFKLKTPPKN